LIHWLLYFLSVFISGCFVSVLIALQNVMPLSAGLFRSQRTNTAPQCPPRLHVQQLCPVSWTRVPQQTLRVEATRLDARHGWQVQCSEPLQVMNLHIPDENRLGRDALYLLFGLKILNSSLKEMNIKSHVLGALA
jgi:hypothetical protein